MSVKITEKKEEEFREFLKQSELFQKEKGSDETYNFNRNCINRLDLLQYCERMWQKFKPYSGDNNFVREFSDKFRQRWWELFLSDSFFQNGLNLESAAKEGPDFKIQNGEQIVWVEAVSMTDGKEGLPNSVPSIKSNHSQTVPLDQILLRLTSGFKEKSYKFQKYLSENIVGENDQLVIAIDMSGISHGIFAEEEDIPLSCKALLGIGELTMSMSIPAIESEGETKTYYNERKGIKKTIGSPIPANGLLMNEFSHISGVLTNMRNFTETEQNPNSLRLLLNPKAKNRLKIGFWKFARDIFFEKDGYLQKWSSLEASKSNS